MNKQNVILDFEQLLNSYKKKNKFNTLAKTLLPVYSENKLTEEYAYLVGKIIGDGHLEPNFTLRFIGKEKDLILLRNLIIDKFELNQNRFSIRRRESKGVSYLLQVNCSLLGRILSLLGAPIGNKTKTKFGIPLWILTQKRFKKRFLQALLEDELSTIKIQKCNYSIRPRLKLAKKEELIDDLRRFMQQVKEAIESFGVTCNHLSRPIESVMTKEIYFHIDRNKKNIIKFRDEIGFRLNQDKIRKLEDCYLVLKNTLRK